MIRPSDILNFNFLCTHLIFLGIFLTLTLSLNLIIGSAGMFSLGHQGFWALGAYAAGAVVILLNDRVSGPLVFALSLSASVMVAALAGLIVGIPFLRLRDDYLAIGTLAFAEITRVILNNFDWLGGSRGLRIPQQLIVRTPESAVAHFSVYLALSAATAGLTALVCHNLLRSAHGRAILALREDDVVAEYMGVPIARYKVLTFLISAAFAGLAGGLYANFFGIISPRDFGLTICLLLLLMVVLGGRRSMIGVTIATVFLYLVQQLFKLRFLGLPTLCANWLGGEQSLETARKFEEIAVDQWQIFFAVLLVVLMIVAPGGFFAGNDTSKPGRISWLQRLFRRPPERKEAI